MSRRPEEESDKRRALDSVNEPKELGDKESLLSAIGGLTLAISVAAALVCNCESQPYFEVKQNASSASANEPLPSTTPKNNHAAPSGGSSIHSVDKSKLSTDEIALSNSKQFHHTNQKAKLGSSHIPNKIKGKKH